MDTSGCQLFYYPKGLPGLEEVSRNAGSSFFSFLCVCLEENVKIEDIINEREVWTIEICKLFYWWQRETTVDVWKWFEILNEIPWKSKSKPEIEKRSWRQTSPDLKRILNVPIQLQQISLIVPCGMAHIFNPLLANNNVRYTLCFS